MKRISVFILALSCLAMMGCSDLHWQYRAIQQGNVIKQKNVAKLHKGMSKKEVTEIMGSPVLENIFNHNRWDYVYTFKKPFGNTTKRTVTVLFSNDRIVRILNIGPIVGGNNLSA